MNADQSERPTPASAARDVSSLLRFGVTKGGGLACLACKFAGNADEVGVPRGYRGMLGWLVKIADNHNRDVHPDAPGACRRLSVTLASGD